MMSRLLKHACAVSLILVSTSLAHAQQTTERYIPIGKSPGISMSRSIMGEISSVDEQSHRMTIKTESSSATVTMSAETRYYLDKTRVKQSNQMGSYEDCEVGRTVEVKVNDDGTVDWVKIKSS